FTELGRLRSYVPTTIPFLATSATLPPLVLSDLQARLHFSMQETFLVTLGNHRPNITKVLVPMRLADDFGGGLEDRIVCGLGPDRSRVTKKLSRDVALHPDGQK